MQLIAPGFYQITNVLGLELLNKLLAQFDNQEHWETLTSTDKNATIRHQLGLHLNSDLAQEIHQALLPIQTFAEHTIAHELYQNSPQLWEDTVGYINQPHCDFSPNLVVNVQIYLGNSTVDNIGTGCVIDGKWYSVPYQSNSGYVMFNPTQVEHGMQHPVVDQRRSLYQSYRATLTACNVW